MANLKHSPTYWLAGVTVDEANSMHRHLEERTALFLLHSKMVGRKTEDRAQSIIPQESSPFLRLSCGGKCSGGWPRAALNRQVLAASIWTFVPAPNLRAPCEWQRNGLQAMLHRFAISS